MTTNTEREWIDADKLREEMTAVFEFWDEGDYVPPGLRARLEALLPTPKPRTLADMDDGEREACQWMQARDDVGNRVIITKLNEGDQEGTVLYESGGQYEWPYSIIVPLPDLPRMVWPDEQATEEDMSIIPPKIDTFTGHDDHVDMTPEDAPDGYYLVRWWGEENHVPAEKVQGQWRATGWRAGILPAKEITIVSRLVPEVEA